MQAVPADRRMGRGRTAAGRDFRGLRPRAHARGLGSALPDVARDVDDPLELLPLLVFGELVAVVRARESALRREAEVLQRHILRRLVDAPLQALLALERP